MMTTGLILNSSRGMIQESNCVNQKINQDLLSNIVKKFGLNKENNVVKRKKFNFIQICYINL
jgi:hypothetical protein